MNQKTYFVRVLAADQEHAMSLGTELKGMILSLQRLVEQKNTATHVEIALRVETNHDTVLAALRMMAGNGLAIEDGSQNVERVKLAIKTVVANENPDGLTPTAVKIKKCEYVPCGIGFIPKRSDQRFHQRACGAAWVREQKKLIWELGDGTQYTAHEMEEALRFGKIETGTQVTHRLLGGQWKVSNSGYKYSLERVTAEVGND